MSRRAVPTTSRKDYKAGQETTPLEDIDTRGNAYVRSSYGYWRACVPDPAQFTEKSCDGVYLTADATVTGMPADDPAAGAVGVALTQGITAIGFSKITIVSAGTVYLLWHRKPNP
jgi:hypothetical protein